MDPFKSSFINTHPLCTSITRSSEPQKLKQDQSLFAGSTSINSLIVFKIKQASRLWHLIYENTSDPAKFQGLLH